MNSPNPDDLEAGQVKNAEDLPWAVEGEATDPSRKSHFYSARKVILDGEYVLIQMEDGSYTSYPIDLVRKVLSMRVTTSSGYTEEDVSEAELY